MRESLRVLTLALPLMLVLISALAPVSLPISIAGMLLGMLLFQLAVVGSFDRWIPSTRRFLDLRAETDRLLELVRELNAAATDARRIGMDVADHVEPIVGELHETVDRLPSVAGLYARPGHHGVERSEGVRSLD